VKFSRTGALAALFAAAVLGSMSSALAFSACQVTDTGGVDDKSFNQTAWKGVTDAQKQLGVDAKLLESKAETDYVPNIRSFLAQKCDIIITVGFLLGDATQMAAMQNPNVKFSIVDFAYDPPIPNVLNQVFATDEGAFLAGYLAAGMTKTGTVGTFGGINIPTVTDYMDGFARGIAYYNKVKNAKVQFLGWDPVKRTGLFTNNFEKVDDGRTFAQNLVDEGADIVLPVAGPVGLGSAALAAQLGPGKLKIIGVDADQYLTDPDHKGVYLTSVLKNMDTTTVQAIKMAMDGTFKGGTIVGSLKSGGVGLAPYHDFDSQIPAALKAEIEMIKQGIIAGTISVKG
jgi:basic membrane protein A and related proteins